MALLGFIILRIKLYKYKNSLTLVKPNNIFEGINNLNLLRLLFLYKYLLFYRVFYSKNNFNIKKFNIFKTKLYRKNLKYYYKSKFYNNKKIFLKSNFSLLVKKKQFFKKINIFSFPLFNVKIVKRRYKSHLNKLKTTTYTKKYFSSVFNSKLSLGTSPLIVNFIYNYYLKKLAFYSVFSQTY